MRGQKVGRERAKAKKGERDERFVQEGSKHRFGI